MKFSRIIEVGLFMGVLLILGISSEMKISLAQNTCTNMRADQYRGQNGQQITCVCPANFALGSIWGSDIYTDDSSICTAAVHAGLISREAGGTVTIEIRPGQQSYRREARVSISGSGETITSNEYGPWSGSFTFVRGGTITQPQQANRAPNAPTLLSPPNTYGTWSPPISSSVTLQWQNNGDPDGDSVSFYIDIWKWDSNSRQWVIAYPIDQLLVNGTSYTLNLQPNTYYAWRVLAADTTRRSSPWYTATNWFGFLTQ
jgi:hypothetical protein